MAQDILSAEALRIGYAQRRGAARIVADGLHLRLRAGELVALIGPNGAGKSTLLRTIAGLQAPLAGQLHILGADVARLSLAERAKHLAIVLTERPDVGLMDGLALVALGRHPHTGWSGRLSADDWAQVDWAIEQVGAHDLAARPVAQLSDGQRQRLMIARALAQETPLILLDEPTAFLDLPRRVEIMRLLRRLAHTTGRAILLSSHDLDLVLRSADVLWILDAGGQFSSGAPEDMVLNGALQAAFQADGLAFDAQAGAFALSQAERGAACVQGEGLPALWAGRALARLGYALDEAATLCIQADAGGYHLLGHPATGHYATLYALMNALHERPT